MPKPVRPRRGSMQFWPRVRAKRVYARVRSWKNGKEAKAEGFAGYKVGMTHVIATDNRSNSPTKGQDISIPVTVVECPPLKVASIRFYKKKIYGPVLLGEIFSDKLDKELSKRITLPKKIKKKVEDFTDYDDIRLNVYTQPKLTAIGKKKPDFFEIGLGGNKEDKLAYAKEKLGKEITLQEVFNEGDTCDIHAITKGKGFAGSVKRFGVSIFGRKKEKVKRGFGSLGGWKGQAHFMYRLPQPGKMGFHQRVEYNKWILKIGDKAEEINPKGGFKHYGNVKSNYLLIKGGIAGSANRIVRLVCSVRPNKKIPKQAPEIQYVSLESRQGK